MLNDWTFTFWILGCALLIAALCAAVWAYRKWGHHAKAAGSAIKGKIPEIDLATGLILGGLATFELGLFLSGKTPALFVSWWALVNLLVVFALVWMLNHFAEKNKRTYAGWAVAFIGIFVLSAALNGPHARPLTPETAAGIASTARTSDCHLSKTPYHYGESEPSTPINPYGTCRIQVWADNVCVMMRPYRGRPQLVCPGKPIPNDVVSVWSAGAAFDGFIGLLPPQYTQARN